MTPASAPPDDGATQAPSTTAPEPTVPSVDLVLERRRKLARFAALGKRAGYLLFLAAIVLFVVGFARSFSPVLVALLVTALSVGSALLAPAIVIGYGVRAADREDAEQTRAAGRPSQ